MIGDVRGAVIWGLAVHGSLEPVPRQTTIENREVAPPILFAEFAIGPASSSKPRSAPSAPGVETGFARAKCGMARIIPAAMVIPSRCACLWTDDSRAEADRTSRTTTTEAVERPNRVRCFRIERTKATWRHAGGNCLRPSVPSWTSRGARLGSRRRRVAPRTHGGARLCLLVLADLVRTGVGTGGQRPSSQDYPQCSGGP